MKILMIPDTRYVKIVTQCKNFLMITVRKTGLPFTRLEPAFETHDVSCVILDFKHQVIYRATSLTRGIASVYQLHLSTES